MGPHVSLKRRLALRLAGAVLASASAPASWGQVDPAVARIRAFCDALLATMKQADRLGIRGRYDKLAPVIGTTFDLPAMTRIAVGPEWNSIAPELRLSGVTVTLISPGFVASEIRRVDNQGKLHEEAKEPIASWLVMPTEKATRQILRAIAKGKREAIITGHGKALVILERFLPWMLRAAGRKMAAGRGGYRAEPKSLRKIEEDES